MRSRKALANGSGCSGFVGFTGIQYRRSSHYAIATQVKDAALRREKFRSAALARRICGCYNVATRTRAHNIATRPVQQHRPSPSPDGIIHRMTNARFDAPASKTRPRRRDPYRHTNRDGIAFHIVRVIWLTALFARRESVSIADYRRRFGVSVRSFRRDVALLRQAGFYLEATARGDYRMLSFMLDSDAP